MRKTSVIFCTAVALGLAMIALYSSCGSTDSDVSPTEALGQFFNQSCASGGTCLTLTAPNSVPADGTTVSGFRARLVDGSGVPIAGQEICFAFEDPGVAVITEPTDACGLTDANGGVSGQFRDGNNTGSFQLVANAPGGFGLRARKTVKFTGAGTVPSGGGGCNLSTDCPSSECSSNSAICGGTGGCCLGGSGAQCTTDTQCASSLVCTSRGTCGAPATPTPAPTPTPGKANGAPCSTSTECLTSCCCTGPVAPIVANTCQTLSPATCTACASP
jgi:hypothetical protein